MSRSAKLRSIRQQKNIPCAPPMPAPKQCVQFLDEQSFGEPGEYYEQEVSQAMPESKGRFSGNLMYILFTVVPFLITGAALYFWNPAFLQLDDGSADITKVVLGAALGGILGFLIKFFLFKD